ncbi:MAG: QueT transporter family protein [Firmicutes bacterium]|nr:QueT transporter family protein [Bacillota bacterium]
MVERNNGKTQFITMAGVIAAAYVVLTFIAQTVGLASGAIQFRLSEVLTILPMFTTAAIPGLAVGCVIANILTGCALWDVVFGSIATLLGALGTHLLKKTENPYLGCLPPIISNMLIVPAVLMKVYGAPESYWYLMLTVGIGEVVCCGVLGVIFYKVIKKRKLL